MFALVSVFYIKRTRKIYLTSVYDFIYSHLNLFHLKSKTSYFKNTYILFNSTFYLMTFFCYILF